MGPRDRFPEGTAGSIGEALIAAVHAATIAPVVKRKRTGRKPIGAEAAERVSLRVPDEQSERWTKACAVLSERAGGIEVSLSAFLRAAGDKLADEILNVRS